MMDNSTVRPADSRCCLILNAAVDHVESPPNPDPAGRDATMAFFTYHPAARSPPPPLPKVYDFLKRMYIR